MLSNKERAEYLLRDKTKDPELTEAQKQARREILFEW